MKWIITDRGPVGPSQYEIEGGGGEIGIRRVQHPTALRPYALAGPAVPAELLGRTFSRLKDARAAAEAVLAGKIIDAAIEAAHAALKTALGLDAAGVADAFAGSGWRDVRDMAEREFAGAWRGYYPKAGMWIRREAAIAVAFDALAASLGDDRRAIRTVSGGDLTRPTPALKHTDTGWYDV